MSEQRDKDLGARLDELDVQEHGPDYWRAVMAKAEPELERLRTAETASSRRPLAAFVERHPTFGGGFKWWATAAVAAVVAVTLLLAGLPGGESGRSVLGPQPATAAEAIGYALTALDRYPGIEGTVVSESAGDYPAEWWSKKEIDFVADPDGSLRIESRLREASFAPRTVRETLVYDAPARTFRTLSDWSEIQPSPSVDPDGGQSYPRWWLERSGLAAAEPDRELPDGGFPLWRVRAYLRTMMSDPEARFSVTKEDGRVVWVLRAEAVSEDYSADRVEPVALPVTITIDAATRLPLSLRRAGVTGARGYPDEVTRFDLHPLSEAPARDRFTLQRPDDPGTRIEDGTDGFSIGGDQGFRDLPFDDAAAVRRATSGMAAFPQWAPRGFRLSSATYRDDGSATSYRPRPGAPERAVMNKFVSLCFRRGYDQAFVSVHVDPRLHSSTIRGTGEDKVRTDTSDPFVKNVDPEVAALWASHTEDVRLNVGWFAGATAHVVLEPETWPHLWVRKGPYIACVAGDLSKAQMVRMANSLQSWKTPGGE
jgi:hypothetical protein